MLRKTLFIFIICLLALSIAYGAPNGASTSVGNSTRGTASTSQTANAAAGNVTVVNVTTTAITTSWAGFYGHVSGTVQLSDASNNIFYQWTLSNVSDVAVYAANGTIANWTPSNIVPLNVTNLPSFLISASIENFTGTFVNLTNFTSSSLNVINTSATYTWSAGSPGPLATYALYSESDGISLWAAIAIDDTTGFDAAPVDYQILVPANATTSYNFYLELP